MGDSFCLNQGTCINKYIITKYKLRKDLPDLPRGVIFEHRHYDSKYPDRGNIGSGCLILGWIDGNCQGSWCGETYILPGQLANNKEWFEPIDINEKEQVSQEANLLKEQILREIELLKKRVNEM